MLVEFSECLRRVKNLRYVVLLGQHTHIDIVAVSFGFTAAELLVDFVNYSVCGHYFFFIFGLECFLVVLLKRVLLDKLLYVDVAQGRCIFYELHI